MCCCNQGVIKRCDKVKVCLVVCLNKIMFLCIHLHMCTCILSIIAPPVPPVHISV